MNIYIDASRVPLQILTGIERIKKIFLLYLKKNKFNAFLIRIIRSSKWLCLSQLS